MKAIYSKIGLFVGGVLFGTAGLKILGSKDAKKVYTQATAAALRANETVMTTVTKVREGADDILADAREINEARLFEEENWVEDTTKVVATEDVTVIEDEVTE